MCHFFCKFLLLEKSNTFEYYYRFEFPTIYDWLKYKDIPQARFKITCFKTTTHMLHFAYSFYVSLALSRMWIVCRFQESSPFVPINMSLMQLFHPAGKRSAPHRAAIAASADISRPEESQPSHQHRPVLQGLLPVPLHPAQLHLLDHVRRVHLTCKTTQ